MVDVFLQTLGADRFLHSVRIRSNSGREYNQQEWTFARQDPTRSEITVVLTLPELRDSEKMREFLRRTWIFARELGVSLV